MARIPSYRHHKASGQAFIEIEGHRYYLGRHGTPESRRKYAEKLSERLVLGNAMPKRTEIVAVSDLIDLFTNFAAVRYVKNGKQTSEVRSFETALSVAVSFYADLPADEFGPLKLMRVRQALIEEGRCRKQVNGLTARIVRCWKWGVSRELVTETTWRALTSVEGIRSEEMADLPPIEPVDIKHVEALKPHVSPVIWGLIQLQLHTGCRPGEACSIRMCDLKMPADSSEPWEYRPESHKTEHHGKQRVIFIGPKGQAALRPFIRTETHVPLFQPSESKEWYMARRRKRDTTKRRKRRPRKIPGLMFTACSLGQAIRKACRKNKIPAWSPNQLRHAAATRIRTEVDLDASRVILGHSAASTTEIYAKEDQAKARRIMQAYG